MYGRYSTDDIIAREATRNSTGFVSFRATEPHYRGRATFAYRLSLANKVLAIGCLDILEGQLKGTGCTGIGLTRSCEEICKKLLLAHAHFLVTSNSRHRYRYPCIQVGHRCRDTLVNRTVRATLIIRHPPETEPPISQRASSLDSSEYAKPDCCVCFGLALSGHSHSKAQCAAFKHVQLQQAR